MQLLVVFSGIFFSAAMLILFAANAWGVKRRLRVRSQTLSKRLRPMTAEEHAEKRLKKAIETSSPTLESLVKRLIPRPSLLRSRLHNTGRDISLGRYLVFCMISGLITFVGAWLFSGAPFLLALLLGLAAAIWVPHFIVGRLIAKRLARFTTLFPDAIDLMVRGLRSGLPVSETIAACGREMADPVGPEFQKIADSVRIGQTLDDALWETVSRLDTPEFKFFVISLSVQKETGGNLAETLSNLSGILRSRKQMKLKIRAMSSEARASALILGSLPFVMFMIIYLINPEYEGILFTDPRGQMMLGAGVGLMGIGGLVMSKMVRFEI
jgi:tight adherence protein B